MIYFATCFLTVIQRKTLHVVKQCSYIVTIWYFNSKFIGKAAAQDIYKKFNKCISELDESKLLQVSSDGPNVNLVFLDLLNEHRSDNELSRLINIGTRGLLQSMYKIFEEEPKRREKYEENTLAKTSDYPLQFCSHRLFKN